MVKFDGHLLTYEEGVEHGERMVPGLTEAEAERTIMMWAFTTNRTEFSEGIAEGVRRGILEGKYRDR